MWPRRRTKPADRADVVIAAEQTAQDVTQALANLELTYQKIREPIMTLEQRFPLMRDQP